TSLFPRGFGAFGITEEFLIVQLFHFSSALKRIVHLAVPSENVSRRGKRIWKSVNHKSALWTTGRQRPRETILFAASRAWRSLRKCGRRQNQCSLQSDSALSRQLATVPDPGDAAEAFLPTAIPTRLL